MVSIHIDISIFLEKEAFGHVAGQIEFVAAPQIGDKVSFPFRSDICVDHSSDKIVKHVTKMFIVTDRILMPSKSNPTTIVSLDDLVVEDVDTAILVCRYFEEAYDLFENQYK